MKFVFTNHAKKQFLKLDNKVQNRIKVKLLLLKQNPSLLKNNLVSIINLEPITHRIKIGSHRLLLKINDKEYIILKIGHRKNIYK